MTLDATKFRLRLLNRMAAPPFHALSISGQELLPSAKARRASSSASLDCAEIQQNHYSIPGLSGWDIPGRLTSLLAAANGRASLVGKLSPGGEGYSRCRDSQTYRIAVRRAALAAMGASTMLAKLSAQSMSRGGQGEAGPTMAAEAVATPKISTGT
jgi:hypothetical protein